MSTVLEGCVGARKTTIAILSLRGHRPMMRLTGLADLANTTPLACPLRIRLLTGTP
jgi:hypothetical protein